MIQFIKYVFKIILCTVLMLYVMDYLYTKIYLNANPRNKLQFILRTKNKHYDIIFLGSSRVANHVDTKLFDSLSGEKTINLGVAGSGLNDNLLQLKLFLNQNTVSNVFLQLDSNFESETPSNLSISEAMPFLKNNIISEHIGKYFENFNQLRYVPFYRYAVNDPKIGFRELFLSVINKKPRVDPSIGFTPIEGKKGKLKGINLPQKIVNSNNILDEIKRICKKNKINLLLFVAPYCDAAKTEKYIEKLIEKNPSLIDLSKGYKDELFYNCGHLNHEGAKLFTTDLYRASKKFF